MTHGFVEEAASPVLAHPVGGTAARPALDGGTGLAPPRRPLDPRTLARLQATAGNAAVCSLLPRRPSPVVQRDITGGDQLPNLKDILRQRLERRIPEPAQDDDKLLEDVRRNIVDGGFLAGLKGTYRDAERDAAVGFITEELKSAATVVGAEANATKLAKEHDATNLDDLAREKERLKTLGDKKFLGNAAQFVSVFFNMSAAATRVTAMVPVEKARDEISTRTIDTTVITKRVKEAFAAALKTLPIVVTLLKSATRDPRQVDAMAGWKGGGSLQGSITEDTEGMATKDQVRADIDNGSFRARVEEADRFIKTVVEPGQLAAIIPPKVVVHTKYGGVGFSPWSWSGSYRFRAFQNGDEVHVASDEETAIIVHETGHYLEKELPPVVWADIANLVQTRHLAKGGGKKAVPSRGGKEEGGFAGDYPVTGPYTSRAYEGGDTEMMSMTLEYLKRPSDTLRMIEQDPVQTALILRAVRPSEYAGLDALRPFDTYLPGPPA